MSERFIGERVIVFSDLAISRVESAISPRRKRLIKVPPCGAIEPTYSFAESVVGMSFNRKPYSVRERSAVYSARVSAPVSAHAAREFTTNAACRRQAAVYTLIHVCM